MRPVNLFLTEDGVLKLGYYGLKTQSECYSIKRKDCEGVRSFAPEVFRGKYWMQSDVWSLGIVLVELMGITPCFESKNDCLSSKNVQYTLQVEGNGIQSAQLAHFLKKCFRNGYFRWNVIKLMNVSVLLWRMMSSIHL